MSLLASYRALYILNWIYRSYREFRYKHNPLVYMASAIQTGMYIVYLVDRKCRFALFYLNNVVPGGTLSTFARFGVFKRNRYGSLFVSLLSGLRSLFVRPRQTESIFRANECFCEANVHVNLNEYSSNIYSAVNSEALLTARHVHLNFLVDRTFGCCSSNGGGSRAMLFSVQRVALWRACWRSLFSSLL